MKSNIVVFSPHQRYTSDGEPELGIGIVVETSKGKVKLYFPRSKEQRIYAQESAPLKRVVFKVGDVIVDTKKQSLRIERVEVDGPLMRYVGQHGIISEADLGDVSAPTGAEDRLLRGDVGSPQAFALRRETLDYDYTRRLSPVNGFVGGRIDLIPHQLYIAHEVSTRYAPRVLLSDQVGLGKTIEACLIVHRLLKTERVGRVLILVPESLVHQWFVEALRRFNLWFHIFDEDRCLSLDQTAPEGNPFLDDQLILCSTQFLANSAKRAQQAVQAGWDMLVVDEAHHLEWSVDAISPEYAVVESLSQVAAGVLLLTATPEQLGEESHFARLRLLDPQRYSSYEAFRSEPTDHKNIADVVEKLHSRKSLDRNDTKLLETLFSKERLRALALGADVVKDQLIEDLLDQHGPGRVLFRNTRSAMSGFPKRVAHLTPLEPAADLDLWQQRLTAEFGAEMGLEQQTSAPKYWFTEDPRLQWLWAMMKKLHPAKILLICKSKAKVLALEAALAKRTKLKVTVFHEDLTIVQRDRNAAWFSEPAGAQVLLCSEIGSEGRNFQFAHHLVLFDLPMHPELLEQRIGRLDRIGQTETIHIHIPYLEGTPQEALVKWYHEGLDAFEQNLEGGNELSRQFREPLVSVLVQKSTPEAQPQLEALISETSSFRKQLQARLAAGRDRLLEMNSFRPKAAEKLVAQIKHEDTDRRLEKYLTKVFAHFDIEMEDLSSRTYFLHPASVNTEAFPTIPSEGIGVTFDRKRALSREEFNFLTCDHPMTTAAIDLVLSSGVGSASYAVLKGNGDPGLLLEVLFVLETAQVQGSAVGRFLPNTPINIIVDHTGKDVTELYPLGSLERKLQASPLDGLLEHASIREDLLPKMIAAATKIAESKRIVEIEKSMQRMNSTLQHELQRLQALQQKNSNIRPEEIQLARTEQSTLSTLIQAAQLRLDALMLIRKA